MEASPGAGPAQQAEGKKSAGVTESGLNVIGMVLAAVGGGIGVLGFVAFFGAAILWIRMNQAHIPANEAVAVIPKSVLLTTGATFLVPALLAAFGFTAFLYLVETGREEWSNRKQTKSEAAWKVRERQAEAKHEAGRKAAEKMAEEIKRGSRLKELAQEASQDEAIGQSAVDEIHQASQQAYENVERLSKEANPIEEAEDAAEPAVEASDETALIAEKRKIDEERAENLDRADRHKYKIRIFSLAILFVAGAVLSFLLFSIHLRLGRMVVLGLLVVGLTAVCISILSRTNFAWCALTTFVAVGVFTGFLTYYRTVDDPKVEPAAVLRSNGAPVFGFFVAQTSDRVYLGTTLPAGDVRLDAIPREDVTDMTIAALQPAIDATKRGRRLALEICRVARERKPRANGANLSGGGKADPAAGGSCTEADYVRMKSAFR